MRTLLVCLLSLVALSGCAAGHMLERGTSPTLAASPESANLVIIRDTRLGFAIAVWNYLDEKMIGETKGGTYFVTKVKPGPHWVVASSENTLALRFDFEPGKTYYLRQDIWMGVWRARAGFTPLDPKEAKEAIESCTYWELDPGNPGEDIDAELLKQAIADYEDGIKNDPEAYKAALEYKGY